MPTHTDFRVYIAASGQYYDLSGLFQDLGDGDIYGSPTNYLVGTLDLTGIFRASTSAEDRIADETYFMVNGTDLRTIFRRRGYGTVIITQQPTNQTVLETATATFTVVATGSGTLYYQWQKYNSGTSSWDNLSNAVDEIAGATSDSLQILNADYPTDEGSYRCLITDDSGESASSSATLTVNYLPTITVQPVSTIYNDGQVSPPTTYSVQATEGKPTGLSYQWQRSTNGGSSWSNLTGDQENSLSGITTNQIAFVCQLARAGYQYRCVVSNSAGSVNSDAATLIINPKITADLLPTRTVTVLSGQNTVSTTFTIVAGGSAVLYYQWYKGASTPVGTNSPSYTVSLDETNDGDEYWCQVSSTVPGFEGLTASAVSTTCTVTVDLTPISISSFLGNGVVNPTVNDGASLSYVVVAAGAGTLNYDFTKRVYTSRPNSYTDSSIQSTSSNTCTFNVDLLDHDCDFYCHVTSSKTSLNSPPSYTTLSTLTVNYLTVVSTVVEETIGGGQSQTTVTSDDQVFYVDEEDLVKIYANADGRPSPSFLWYKWGGSSYVAVTGAHISGQSSAVLVFNGILESDYAYYICQISNGQGLVGYSTQVVIAVLFVEFIDQPNSIVKTTGEQAVFSATFNLPAGAENLNYEWKKDGQVVQSGTVSSGYGQTLTYTINSVAMGNQGDYELTIGTRTTSTASLHIAPKIISTNISAGSYNYFYGNQFDETLSLSILDVEGETPFTYQWYKNDISLGAANGADTSAFEKVIANGDSGTYKCVVSNAYGSATTGNFYITALNGDPTITTQPTNRYVNNNATATFTIAATSNGGIGINYQWMKNVTEELIGETSTSYTTDARTTDDDNDTFHCVVSTDFGTVNSNAVSTKIIPYITGGNILDGSFELYVTNVASFSVTAAGSGTLSYAWQYSTDNVNWGSVLSTSTTYILGTLTNPSQSGFYRVTVSSAYGSTFATAQLTVLDIAPVITGGTVTEGPYNFVDGESVASFTVTATGTNLSIVWYYSTDNVNFSATGDTGTQGPVKNPAYIADSGYYKVIVSNSNGSDSATAILTVT